MNNASHRILLHGWTGFKLVSMNAQKWSAFFLEESLLSLQIRLAPSLFDNPQGATLFKVTQQGSIIDYQTQFELLSNQITGL